MLQKLKNVICCGTGLVPVSPVFFRPPPHPTISECGSSNVFIGHIPPKWVSTSDIQPTITVPVGVCFLLQTIVLLGRDAHQIRTCRLHRLCQQLVHPLHSHRQIPEAFCVSVEFCLNLCAQQFFFVGCSLYLYLFQWTSEVLPKFSGSSRGDSTTSTNATEMVESLLRQIALTWKVGV